MLLDINKIPPDIKLCKILTIDKIKQKSTIIDPVPKPGDSNYEMFLNVCWRMVKTCLNEDGIGLAACQIGVFKSLFIIREDKNFFKAFINPSYEIDINSVIQMEPEGCLSIPGVTLNVPRYSIIKAKWTEVDVENNSVVKKEQILEGLKSVAWQHETDHGLAISILNRVKK